MWISTFLLTLFFVLISLGFGLTVLALASVAVIKESRLTRLQLIVLGFTVGGPGTGVCLQVLSLISANLYVDLGIVVSFSLLGLLTTRTIWAPRSEDRGDVALFLAMSLPIAMLTWWWTFGVFSHFPFGDIGADVHWIKTAQEFADTGILNPYASQSYIDLRPALAGALSATLGLDLLQFNWVYRYFSILYLMIVFYAVADSVFVDPRRKWLAFFLASVSNVIGLATNGVIAMAGSFVFLIVLTKSEPDRKETYPAAVLLTVGAVFVGLLLAFCIDNNTLLLASLPAISLLYNLLRRMGAAARDLAKNTFAGLIWSLALMLVHRGSYFFVPVAVAGWLFYMLVSRILSRGTPSRTRTLWTFAMLLPLMCACILVGLVAERIGYLHLLNANKLFSYVTLFFLGREIKSGDEINLGTGPQIAAIEIGRAIGPFFAIGVSLIFAWWRSVYGTARLTDPPYYTTDKSLYADSERITRLLWSWLLACGLSLAVLSGFPFLYRIALLISGMFTIAATELFCQIFVDPAPNAKRRRTVAIVSAASITIVVFALYSISWHPNLPYVGYQTAFRPSEIAGVAIVIIFAGLTFARSHQVQIISLTIVIGLSITIDRSGLSTLFREYSYGRLPDRTTIVSHYNAHDLKAAYWLRVNMPRAIIVSDPYTLNMAAAITGLPALYLSSNLDTVNRAGARHVKALIGSMVDPGPVDNAALRTCTYLSPLVANLNQEAQFRLRKLDYSGGVFKHVRAERERDEATILKASEPESAEDVQRRMQMLETSQGDWKVVAIINSRTIQWVHSSGGDRTSYFPPEEALEYEVRTKLQDGPFRTVFVDGYDAIVPIDCTAAVNRPNDKPF